MYADTIDHDIPLDTPPFPLTGPWWKVTITDPIGGTWADGVQSRTREEAVANAAWNWVNATSVVVNGRYCEHGGCGAVAMWRRTFERDEVCECTRHAQTDLDRADRRALGGLLSVARLT